MMENMSKDKAKDIGEMMRQFLKTMVEEDPDCPEEVKVRYQMAESFRRLSRKLHLITDVSLGVEETKERLEYLACVEGGLDSFMEQKGIHYDEE